MLGSNHANNKYLAVSIERNSPALYNALRMLLGLTRFCKASGYLPTLEFIVFKLSYLKRSASILSRLLGNDNSILRTLLNKMDMDGMDE